MLELYNLIEAHLPLLLFISGAVLVADALKALGVGLYNQLALGIENTLRVLESPEEKKPKTKKKK